RSTKCVTACGKLLRGRISVSSRPSADSPPGDPSSATAGTVKRPGSVSESVVRPSGPIRCTVVRPAFEWVTKWTWLPGLDTPPGATVTPGIGSPSPRAATGAANAVAKTV